MVSDRRRLQSSHQYQTHLLCNQCEDRFNKHGEAWVTERCYRGQGIFRLRDLLGKAPPVYERGGTKLIAAAAIPEISVSKLVYFAASVFWRAGVQTWKIPVGEARIELGNPYEEQFRQYLMGKVDFPAEAALLVSVSSSPDPLLICGVHSAREAAGFHVHTLVIPGISFRLCVGKLLTREMHRACFLRSPENLIYFSNDWDKLTAGDVYQTVGNVLRRS
jgi:hypothetical protein